MSSSRNETSTPGARPEEPMISSSEIVAEMPVAAKPDPLGKYRRRVMREMKRLPEYRSWHPAQKMKMRHLVMRHLNPDRGFMMRQGEFAKELRPPVRREKVNIFLKQAVERELLTPPRGSDGKQAGWRGANVYFLHPRILEAAQQTAHSPAHRGAQLEVTQGKRCKGKLRVAEASRSEENHAAASADASTAESVWCDREALEYVHALADEWVEDRLRTGVWDEAIALAVEAESSVPAEPNARSAGRHDCCHVCRVELVPGRTHICRGDEEIPF